MEKPKILAFAGSTRTESYNKKLVKIAAQGAEAAGGDVTTIDLRDFPMPLFDQDFETKEGLPPAARALKRLMLSHQGFLISAPEYNSSITGVLKNAIDWTSRQETGESPLACFEGKIAVLMSASPSGFGGMRGLVHLRAILGNIGVLVLPGQIAVSKAHEAFDPSGALKDSKQDAAVKKLAADLAKILTQLNP